MTLNWKLVILFGIALVGCFAVAIVRDDMFVAVASAIMGFLGLLIQRQAPDPPSDPPGGVQDE